jgi:hypothetical protein
MKEEYKILEQNLEVLNKNSEKYKKTMKIHDIGVDTTSFSEFFDNSFNFKEIKSDYLSNLISFSFLKKVGGFYQWPLLCFSNLVENSIIHGKAKNIFIDIKCYENEIYKRLELATKNTNLEEYKKSSPNLESYNGIYTDKKLVLSIGDDGGGISREIFNKILFCFDAKDTSIMSCINNNQNYLNKNINIKSCCLRLGDSVFILSKTKEELNIGLISKQLQMKMHNDLILTPLVNYEIIKDEKNENKNKYIFKSQMGLQSENIILNEIRFLFWSVNEIFSFADTFNTGTYLFIFDLKQFSSNKNLINTIGNFELFFGYKSEYDLRYNDILYNTMLKQKYLENLNYLSDDIKNDNSNNMINVIDVSLRKYLELFLVNYNGVNVTLLSEKINTENNIITKLSSIVRNNLYMNEIMNSNINDKINSVLNSENILILEDSFSLKEKKNINKEKINIIILKGELYKGILIKKSEKKKNIIKIINDTFNVDITDCIDDLISNNILIYLENRLVCRLGQNKFGDLPYYIKMKKKKDWYYNYMGYIELPKNGLYELNLIKSEFKDNSMSFIFFSKINNLIKKLNKN